MNHRQDDVAIAKEQLRRTLTAAIQFVNDPEHLPNIDKLDNEIKILKLVQAKLS